MTTSHDQDLLALYVGGDLSPAVRVQVEAHLATCPDCRAQAEALRAGRAWLAVQAAAEQAPFSAEERRALRDAVMAQVRREAGRRPLVWRSLLGAAAALLLAVGLARTLWQARPAPGIQARVDPPVQGGPLPASAGPAVRPGQGGSPRIRVARLSAPASATPVPEPGPARIEFQTDNPNIRIIWLAKSTPDQPETQSPQELP